MGTRVYVGDLGDHGNQRELEEVFSHFGSLKEVWIAKDPKGFAFVEFNYPEEANSAIKQLDGSTVCGCKVRVEMARDSRRGRGRGRGMYMRGSNPYRRSSPSSYSRDRRDDRGPRGPSFRDRDVGYYDKDYSRTSGDNYIGSRRDMYTPPPNRGDSYRGRSDYEGPRNTDPYYESSSYRSIGGNSYGSRSASGYDAKSRDYSPGPGRRDMDYGSSGPRGYIGSAPSFRDDQYSSYDNDNRGYYRRDDYHGGLSTRNGDKARYGGRSPPMRSPRRSFRDRSPY